MRQADSVSPMEGLASRRTAQSGFRPDIEGLRAVAVVAVVLFHAEVPGVGGGFVGVDVFFVILGFLITGLLWREVSTAGTVGLRSFYGARARRLLPASATVGVVTMIASRSCCPRSRPGPSRGRHRQRVVCRQHVVIAQATNYFFSDDTRRRSGAYFIGRRGAVLPGVAAPDHRYGLADSACVAARRRATIAQTPSSQRPYLVVLALVAA